MTGRGQELPAPAPFAVVVVAYGSADEIAEVVASAAAVDGCAQVVVVDNGSDGSATIAEAAGATVVRRPDNPGFGTSQNAGVACTDAPLVLLLNPDARLDATGVAAGRRFLADPANASVGVVQGTITNRGTGEPERSMGDELGPIHLWGRALFLRHLLGTSLGRWAAARVGVRDHVERVPTEPVDVEALAATAPLVRRAAFESVGGFDERYFLYGEDLDLCRRLRRVGWRLVGLPVPWAEHVSGGTSSSWWGREIAWWEGTLQFGARWWTDRRWRLARGAALARALVLVAMRPRAAGRVWDALVRGPGAVRAASTVAA